jgi:hypothetical protein
MAAGATSLSTGAGNAQNKNNAVEKEIYELRIYQMTGTAAKTQLKNYITSAVSPYIHELGGKTGIFSEYGLTEPPRLYVLLTFPSPEAFYKKVTGMEADSVYLANAGTYLLSPPEKPLFERYETMLLEAFDAIPRLRRPDPSGGLFELRIYESYNEDAGRRKIKMFNHEELALFDKVGLPSFFFGKIIAGTHMPALAYMLCFRDMVHREEAWTKFRSHPDWNTMKEKPEYANTVSRVNKIFLVPEEGSAFQQ